MNHTQFCPSLIQLCTADGNTLDSTTPPRKRLRTDKPEGSTQMQVDTQQRPARLRNHGIHIGLPHVSSSGKAGPSHMRLTRPGSTDTGGNFASTSACTHESKASVHIVDKHPGEGEGAALGDTLDILYILYVNGEPLIGESRETTTVRLGSQSMLEGEYSLLICQRWLYAYVYESTGRGDGRPRHWW